MKLAATLPPLTTRLLLLALISAVLYFILPYLIVAVAELAAPGKGTVPAERICTIGPEELGVPCDKGGGLSTCIAELEHVLCNVGRASLVIVFIISIIASLVLAFYSPSAKKKLKSG